MVYGGCIVLIGYAFLFIVSMLWKMGMLPGVPYEQPEGLKTNDSRIEETLTVAVWLGT